jgi:hypothetical protein
MNTIRIKYCEHWGYQPRAARAAALITKETGLPVEITLGKRGEYSVWVGDTQVAQKDRNGFPDEHAVLAAVQRAVA